MGFVNDRSEFDKKGVGGKSKHKDRMLFERHPHPLDKTLDPVPLGEECFTVIASSNRQSLQPVSGGRRSYSGF